ncbi:thiamine-triphosphatase [Latimeria chalumnae]|uniref:Thiamine-triphosphatase n=1 Tax=Latimeria chalumnae TaxID=7897 RepID=H3ABC8_LATCH|nr:PREDICTED: thiamine-triphosphatase [Latimeria chalumnae]|eukprot:XP_006006386.1 PREDICTED: thiamine-triphosphatase [Latimeria chalumnae]
MASDTMEVERKFVLGADTEVKLHKLGAEVDSSLSFEDRYFDTSDFKLTLQDTWLRNRAGCWELKCPVNGNCQEDATTHYRELTGEDQIVSHLSELLGLQDLRGCPLDELLCQASLEVFAAYVTERKGYSMPGGIHIDLDRANFGYQVGEIEVMVDNVEKIPEAVRKINSVAEKLGLDEKERIPGKMYTYLKRFCPLHYQALLAAHVLHSE